MSGPAVHHLIAQRFLKTLPKKGLIKESFAQKLATEWQPYFLFGCQGPDPLFFNTKDMHPLAKEFASTFIDVQEFIEDFKEQIMAIIPPQVLAAAAKLQEVWADTVQRSALLSEIEQGLTAAKNLLVILEENLLAAGKKWLTDEFNVFDKLLTHPIQDKGKYAAGQWWWFDTLHYRKTGQYATQLLKNAKPDSAQMAYALGYLTHFSADVTGHPFVNVVSGGPYRTHAQRHKFVENHQDVWAWQQVVEGQEFVQSKAGEQYIINGDAGELPPDFNQYLRNTIAQVYTTNGLHYGAPMTAEDLDDTYRLWLKWFRSLTNTLDLPKPVPYSLTKEMLEAWEKFAANFSEIVDAVKGPKKGKKSIWNIFKAILAAALAQVLLAAALVDFVLGLIATLGAAPLRYLISVAYEALYNSFMEFHQGLVLNGLAFPFTKQLQHPAALQTIRPDIPDTMHIRARDVVNWFPMKKFKFAPARQESHLIYPVPFSTSVDDAMREKDRTEVAPGSYFTADAFHYMWDPGLPVIPGGYETIRTLHENSASSDQLFKELATAAKRGHLGNAVELSHFLMAEVAKGKTIADINLDGDRGYAFPCWRRVNNKAELDKATVLHRAVEDVAAFEQHNVLQQETDIIYPSQDIL